MVIKDPLVVVKVDNEISCLGEESVVYNVRKPSLSLTQPNPSQPTHLVSMSHGVELQCILEKKC